MENGNPYNNELSVAPQRRNTALYTIILLALLIGFFVGLYSLGKVPKNVADFADKLLAGVVTLIVGDDKSNASDTLSLEGPQAPIESGKPFTVSWENESNEGSYFINYECAAGLSLSLVSDTNSKQTLSCDENFELKNKSEVTLVAENTIAAPASTMIRIIYSETGTSETAKGLATITVESPKIAQEKPVTSNPKPAAPTKPVAENPTPKPTGQTLTPGEETSKQYPIIPGHVESGSKPDLSSNIIAFGTLNTNNDFTATTSLKATDKIAVQFEVKNQGTKETGTWHFNAVLPTFPSHIFTSETQQSLKSGEKIVFTLGFNKIAKESGNEFVVNADPTNSLAESSEENNIARITINDVKF